MSTNTLTGTPTAPTFSPALRAAPALKVTQWRVMRSEWIKFKSLRSTVWTLLIAIILTIGISALFSAVTASNWSRLDAIDRIRFNAVSTSLTGVNFAQLAIGVLGVLFISSEYSTGMIRSSITVVPKRLPMLWAKVAVFGGLVGILSIITCFASFFVGQALLTSSHNVSISSPGAIRMILGAALYLTVAGIIGMMIGALLRNTAGAISAFVTIFFVLPPILELLPSSWRDAFTQYLPGRAGEAIWAVPRDGAKILSAGAGLGLFIGYAVVLMALAAIQLRRRDS